jgi:hypothetical protein
MSFYTKFADVEPLLSSTSSSTTTVLGSTDVTLVFNNASGKYFQATIGSLSNAGYGAAGVILTSTTTGVTVATTNTTGTNINAYGLTRLLSTGGSSCSWLLNDSTSPGSVKTLIFHSSTTSTLYAVTFQTNTCVSTGAAAGTLINFASTASGALVNFGQGVDLIALSTSQWAALRVYRNPTAVTSGIIFAVGTGPIFT